MTFPSYIICNGWFFTIQPFTIPLYKRCMSTIMKTNVLYKYIYKSLGTSTTQEDSYHTNNQDALSLNCLCSNFALKEKESGKSRCQTYFGVTLVKMPVAKTSSTLVHILQTCSIFFMMLVLRRTLLSSKPVWKILSLARSPTLSIDMFKVVLFFNILKAPLSWLPLPRLP
jgi:hypothetical protein